MIALFLMMLALLYGWVTALYDLWYFTIPAVYYRFSVLLMGLAMGCAVFFMPWSATLSFWLDHGLGFPDSAGQRSAANRAVEHKSPTCLRYTTR